MNELFEKEKHALIESAKSAFEAVERPSWAHDCSTVEELQAKFGQNYFYDLSGDMYNFDSQVIKYLVPQMIEFYVLHFGDCPDKDYRLEDWLYFWEHFDERIPLVRDRYREIYESFNPAQRQVLCAFLKFVKKYELGDTLHMSDSIAYWCS